MTAPTESLGECRSSLRDLSHLATLFRALDRGAKSWFAPWAEASAFPWSALLPDDPRPLLYEGLCYERLTSVAQSPEEKRQQFALGEAALREALTLNFAAPDYSSALPYRALASLYSHVNDFQSVLDSLKKAQRADTVNAESTHLDREIQGVEQFLAKQGTNH
jgi:tetratricopeptide (TPR) repeat protein